jgi:hypothetical protein
MSFLKNLFRAKSPLKNGEKIKITWLPYNNGYPNKNVYIGSEGVVEDLHEDGSFCLRMETAILVVYGKYKFKRV